MVPEDCLTIILNGINSVTPSSLFKKKAGVTGNRLIIDNLVFEFNRYDNIFLTGAGKAAAYMAESIEKFIGDRITGGIVSVKYGHTANLKYVRQIEAGHPLPDSNSFAAGEKIFALLNKAGKNDLVIFLISGGGSSLMEKLPDNISPVQFQDITDQLVRSGANIAEINTVRISLSMLKGGKLANITYPADAVILLISDVPGDDPAIIASGPFYQNNIKQVSASEILSKYKIEYPSGLKKTDPSVLKKKYPHIILGRNDNALEAAKEKAKSIGYQTKIFHGGLTGELNLIADKICEEIISEKRSKRDKPVALLWGGEPTIKVTGKGTGGRNTHLALTILARLKDSLDYTFISSGTDGTDGPTDAAGAIVSSELWQKIADSGPDAVKHLHAFDSYNFFKITGSLIITGPTGTNVMDIACAII